MNTNIKNNLIHFLEDKQHLNVPGNGLLIRHKDQEIFRHFTGEATKDTLFRIYSMTKVVTVVSALQLLEAGKYTLDDPVSLYLPEYEIITIWDPEKKTAVPTDRVITVRHLFTMTAGLTYPGDQPGTPAMFAELIDELSKEYPDESYTTQQMIRLLPQKPFAFEAGSHWNYSLCHDVLGALIEVWSGQTLGEYMKEHIFLPLGMTHTFFRCPEELVSNMAANLTDFDDKKFGPQARYEAGGGGLLSTLDDYMKFASTLTRGGTSVDGVRILGRKTIDLMRMDHLTPQQKEDFNWDYLNGYSYGLGVRTLIDPARAGIAGTVGEFGWCGVLGTWVLMDPEEELTVVYMHQAFPNLEKYVQTHLRAMIYSAI